MNLRREGPETTIGTAGDETRPTEPHPRGGEEEKEGEEGEGGGEDGKAQRGGNPKTKVALSFQIRASASNGMQHADGRETLELRAALKGAQEAARAEALRWEDQVANLNLLQTKEGDRADRLQLLLRLTGLQRIQVEQDRDRLQQALQAERQRGKEQERALKECAALAQARVDEAQRLEQKQAKYIQTLESECRAQSQRVSYCESLLEKYAAAGIPEADARYKVGI